MMTKRMSCILILIFLCLNLQAEDLNSRDSVSLRDESGFITIEPVNYYFYNQSFFNRLPLRSEEARLWYTFQAADQAPASKPLFVFFNGGPGAATSVALMSFNTGKRTVCSGEQTGECIIRDNPASWSQLGNLLYIDARQTGFSYSMIPDHDNKESRYKSFSAKNFNCFFDAADFIRLLLEFYTRHPALRKNPVIIVGESYGGVRATVMLHILLNYKDYRNGSAEFQDPALAQRLQDHYNLVFPGHKGSEVPAHVIAGQFGHQVLIQPLLDMMTQNRISYDMFEQEGSPIFQIAEEEGLQYVPCRLQAGENCSPYAQANEILNAANRDLYMYTKASGWTFELFFGAGRELFSVANLSQLTGMDVGSIDGLYASARKNAFRVVDPETYSDPEQKLQELPASVQWEMNSLERLTLPFLSSDSGDLESHFGTLNPWDFYMLPLNRQANISFHYNLAADMGFEIDTRSTKFVKMFLKNTAHVKTFITNAAYDLIIYSPAIPRVLAAQRSILTSASHQTGNTGNEERPGRIVLNYKAGAFDDISNLTSRTVRFPRYSRSGHSVPLNEPMEMLNDVAAWLTQ
ncbi:MAG: S10 family peptidase [bacterium]|nr:S10 family peptidase [bacterium]